MDSNINQNVAKIVDDYKNQIIIYEQTIVFDKSYLDEDEFFKALAKSVETLVSLLNGELKNIFIREYESEDKLIEGLKRELETLKHSITDIVDIGKKVDSSALLEPDIKTIALSICRSIYLESVLFFDRVLLAIAGKEEEVIVKIDIEAQMIAYQSYKALKKQKNSFGFTGLALAAGLGYIVGSP